MKIYLKEEVLKLTFICLDATCSPIQPTIQPSDHSLVVPGVTERLFLQ